MARYWREWLLGGGYVLLLFAGFWFQSATAWAWIALLLMGQALLAWHAALARLRAVADTPTARVASAAQGYVELAGIARADPESAVYSPAHHLPCLWYRYRAYQRSGDNWRQIESGESEATFMLEDASGRCLVDPVGAEVHAARKETITQGDHRIEEELLLAGDRLHVLGEFVSLGGGHARFDERVELGTILAEWKEDREALHRRFDLDGNGQIDPDEWQLARQAARRELAERRLESDREPVTHVLRRSRHGRPYLIANFPPETLAGRYRFAVWAHGLAAYASLIGLAWALA